MQASEEARPAIKLNRDRSCPRSSTFWKKLSKEEGYMFRVKLVFLTKLESPRSDYLALVESLEDEYQEADL